MNATYSFDGTTYTITAVEGGYDVTVQEGKVPAITLTNANDKDQFDAFARHGRALSAGMKRAGMDAWTADRIAFCFELADRQIARAALLAA